MSSPTSPTSLLFPFPKPHSLKQRTSSVDARRDCNTTTWTSLVGLLKVREFVITVDHFSIWKRHLAWAMENGKDLREYMTQRYASSMVILSLLLSTELGVLFNSAGVTTAVRQSLQHEEYGTCSFWAGILVIISAILTLLGLISTFTAWTMVSSVSEANAHCIFRSSIGQYVAELPGRFIVGAVYTFLLWLSLFFFLLLPVGFWSLLLLLVTCGLFVHTISAFSTFGRIIMHSGAMSSNRILEKSFESSLSPHLLHNMLLAKAKANLGNHTSIMRQYRAKTPPMDRHYSLEEMARRLSTSGSRCDDAPILRMMATLESSSSLGSNENNSTNNNNNNHDNDDNDNSLWNGTDSSGMSNIYPHATTTTNNNATTNNNGLWNGTDSSGMRNIYQHATSSGDIPRPPPPRRKRTESLVKFADGYDTNGERFAVDVPAAAAPAALSSSSVKPAATRATFLVHPTTATTTTPHGTISIRPAAATTTTNTTSSSLVPTNDNDKPQRPPPPPPPPHWLPRLGGGGASPGAPLPPRTTTTSTTTTSSSSSAAAVADAAFTAATWKSMGVVSPSSNRGHGAGNYLMDPYPHHHDDDDTNTNNNTTTNNNNNNNNNNNHVLETWLLTSTDAPQQHSRDNDNKEKEQWLSPHAGGEQQQPLQRPLRPPDQRLPFVAPPHHASLRSPLSLSYTPTTRNTSITSLSSSLDHQDHHHHVNDSHLTEEEKFDRDYGDLFGPDGYSSPTNIDDQADNDDDARLVWMERIPTDRTGTMDQATTAWLVRTNDTTEGPDNGNELGASGHRDFSRDMALSSSTETSEPPDVEHGQEEEEERQQLLNRTGNNHSYDSIPNGGP